MGEHQINQEQDAERLRRFTKKLLTDLKALQQMLEEGRIESDRSRIGAEQETFLVDSDWRPAPRNLELLELLDDPRFTTELGRFNMEFNLDPIALGGDCLGRMEEQLTTLLDRARKAAQRLGVEVVLVGILPTLDPSDLSLDNMTPIPRYFALNDAMNRLRGREYDLYLKGRDELRVHHDNVMLESCNTSFQVHFQVSHEEFAKRYNVAQAVAAPVLACATFSPLLFGRQLWRETRIALFQQSVDTRGVADSFREVPPRVSFGRDWVRESALEIFQEDIARFRVILSTEVEEDPFEVLARGEAPRLDALRLHNGTIYRWNRPCYGISDGKPHLRIENRVLPAGPTPLDEMANAAFWFGLMKGIDLQFEDITRAMDFNVARENFVAAARLGLAAHLHWPGRGLLPAQKLILEELLPLARQGLRDLDIDDADGDRYLGIIEERVSSLQTGAKWIIDSCDSMADKGSRSECFVALTAAISERQRTGAPVHTWSLATVEEAGDFRKHYVYVEQVMTTDLFTVSADELIDMAAYVMNWKHIRHVPVEDSTHRLVGLVTHRSLLRMLGDNESQVETRAIPVREIMQTELVTVRPKTTTREAIDLMRRHKISCLPVVTDEQRLVGIVTEHDFMGIAGQLLDQFLDGETE